MNGDGRGRLRVVGMSGVNRMSGWVGAADVSGVGFRFESCDVMIKDMVRVEIKNMRHPGTVT